MIEAENGQEGYERTQADAPDLVLLDVSMPVLDGFGLATAVRRDERTRHVPLVFLTGEATREAEELAFAAGAVGYFTKPFDPAVISRFISEVLAASRQATDAVALPT